MIRLPKETADKLASAIRPDGRMSAADYQRVVLGQNPQTARPQTVEKRAKYGAERVEHDGIRFDSRLEADCYARLRAAGGLFLRQVPLHLPGGVRYVVDFLRILDPSAVDLVDAKGVITPMYSAKRRMVEDIYAPLRIHEVTRADLRAGALL